VKGYLTMADVHANRLTPGATYRLYRELDDTGQYVIFHGWFDPNGLLAQPEPRLWKIPPNYSLQASYVQGGQLLTAHQ
jgi:hypothetical protein